MNLTLPSPLPIRLHLPPQERTLQALEVLTIATGFLNPAGVTSIHAPMSSSGSGSSGAGKALHSRVLAYDINGDVIVATYSPLPAAAAAAGKGSKRKNSGEVSPTATCSVDYSRTSVISVYDATAAATVAVTHAFTISGKNGSGDGEGKSVDGTSAHSWSVLRMCRVGGRVCNRGKGE
jgi:hypothetical protein